MTFSTHRNHFTLLKGGIVALSLGAFSHAAPMQAEMNSALSPIQDVANRLTGTLIYAQESSPDIQIKTCEVQFSLAQTDSIFLYQEQARVDRAEKPYRQRFLKLFPQGKTIISESYRPKEAQSWVGLCDRDLSQLTVSKTDLLPTHCYVSLQKQDDVWLGETPPEGCHSNYRGASVVKNKIKLERNGMKTYDQGLNDKGEVVWGSEGKPYVFKKQITGE